MEAGELSGAFLFLLAATAAVAVAVSVGVVDFSRPLAGTR
jgi:beta-mannan synthase